MCRMLFFQWICKGEREREREREREGEREGSILRLDLWNCSNQMEVSFFLHIQRKTPIHYFT